MRAAFITRIADLRIIPLEKLIDQAIRMTLPNEIIQLHNIIIIFHSNIYANRKIKNAIS